MSDTGGRRLVIVDLQNIFAAGEWATPRFSEVLAPAQRLVAAFGPDRTAFTRFVAPAAPEGSWVEYYQDWPFALQPPDSPDYQLVPEFAGYPTLDAPTFGKWPVLRDRLGLHAGDELVVCGVSTDCCVISTVLAAADAGLRVRVVTDACAGLDDTTHQEALDVMALFTPQVRLATTEEVLAGLG